MAGASDRTVSEALIYLGIMATDTERTITDLELSDHSLSEFEEFQTEIRLLHLGIIQVLNAMDAQPDDAICLFLRSIPECWTDPPLSSLQGLEEVQILLGLVTQLVDDDNDDTVVQGFDSIFEGQFLRVIAHVNSDNDRDTEEQGGYHGWKVIDRQDPGASPWGVTEAQLHKMAVRIATYQDERETCAFCQEQFVASQKMRILPCLHSFHKECIDSCLRETARCPVDLSIIHFV